MSLIFRQLFEKISSSYTYILGCKITRECVIIDPVLEEKERDIKLLNELKLNLKYTFNTHMHADHVRSCQELKKAFPSNNIQSVIGDPLGKSDIMLKDNDSISIGDKDHINIISLHTPGHTDGCFSFYVPNYSMIFTGDAMLIRRCGRTDFQNGNANDLYHSISKILYGLPDDTIVYPGHDYAGFISSTIEEEKLYNIRCNGNTTEAQFVERMNNLQLNPPKNIEYNVEQNRLRG